MSEQPGTTGAPGQDETTLSAGVPGPSGTGEQTDAGADPAAPTPDAAPTPAAAPTPTTQTQPEEHA